VEFGARHPRSTSGPEGPEKEVDMLVGYVLVFALRGQESREQFATEAAARSFMRKLGLTDDDVRVFGVYSFERGA